MSNGVGHVWAVNAEGGDEGRPNGVGPVWIENADQLGSKLPEPEAGDTGKVLGVLNADGDIGWVPDQEGMAQVQADWDQTDSSQVSYIANKPNLATVATTGAYSDLSGTPTIPTVDQTYDASSTNAQAGVAVAGAIATKQDTISDLATIRSGAAAGATAVQPAALNDYATTSALTSGLSTKQDTISDLATIRSGAAAGATAVQPGDLATVATTGSYNDLSNKPTIPSTKPLVAGTNITITENTNDVTISAAGGASYSAGTGIDITNNVISADTTVLATQSDLGSYTPTSSLATVATTGNYSDLSGKPTIPSGAQLVPAATSADADKVLTVNSLGVPGWAVIPAQPTGLFEAVYGTTTFADIAQAVTDKRIVYCKVDQGNGLARMAFLAFVSSVAAEFQYYRSISSHSASTQTDEVYIYKVNADGWTTTTRKAGVNVTAGTHMSQSYSNDTLTLNCTWPTVDQTYNSASTNAQSGTAVAQAIAAIPSASYTAGDGIDITANEVSVKAGTGLEIDDISIPGGTANLVSQDIEYDPYFDVYLVKSIAPLTSDLLSQMSSGLDVSMVGSFYCDSTQQYYAALYTFSGGQLGNRLVLGSAHSPTSDTIDPGTVITFDTGDIDTANSTVSLAQVESNISKYRLGLVVKAGSTWGYSSWGLPASAQSVTTATYTGMTTVHDALCVSNPVPASAVGDAGKVLTVNAQGAAAWGMLGSVTSIQQVNALPANPDANTLYLIPEA